MENYNTLIQKLDEFIRKYYKNQLIRGLLYSVAVGLAFFLSIALLEYFGHFGTTVRTFMFYSFLAVNSIIIYRLVALPLIHLNRMGKIISYEEASQIIGKHFSNVSDKLLNTLQLKQLADNGSANSRELLYASIDQKTAELKPVPFAAAIDLSENKKYLRYALPPVLAALLLIVIAPNILRESTTRLVNHNTYFETIAPFKFVIENNNLRAMQHEDFTLNLKMEGAEIPAEVFVEVDDNLYRLDKQSTLGFSYIFKNLQKSTSFRLYADGFYSKEYELIALPKPLVLNFNISLDYPDYTGHKDETVNNTGDLTVPAGTKAVWNFNTRDARELRMSFGDTAFAVNASSSDNFSYASRLFKNKQYSVTVSNEFLQSNDSILYHVNVIPDAFPAIEVEEKQDSLSSKLLYFSGITKDDYGFKKLNFVYRFLNSEDTEKKEKVFTEDVFISKNKQSDQFFYSWDVTPLNIQPGDNIEYYFEVWDNDGVSGSKATRSEKKLYKAPTLSELSKENEKKSSELKKDMEQSIKDAKALQKEVAELNKKLFEKKNLTWEDRKNIQSLLDKQKKLENEMQEIQQENKKKNNQQNEFNQLSPELLEKQKQLEKMFDELMTPEMKELFRQMEEMMEKMDKDKAREMLEKMEMTNEDLSKEMDRQLEIFKQLEFEQKLNESIEKLNKLAEKEEKLSEETKEKKGDATEEKEKQDELNKEFEDVKKDLDELEKKNSELEQPNKMEDTKEDEKGIEQDMQKSSQEMGEQKNQKASQSQKSASQKMKSLSEKMQAMQQQMQQEQQSEDIKSLRDILENLLTLSFDQEKLMAKLKNTNRNDPGFTSIAREQLKLKNDSKLIEDSLFALSKRVVQLQTIVNREIRNINQNMDVAIENLAERQTSLAQNRQQLTMTSINNLALMLSEVVQQMQQAQAQSKPGQGSCSKPGQGQGKPSAATMKALQEQLNKQIEQMQKGMQKGQKPGEKPGGSQGMGGMSEGLAKMAAQQEAIRQMLQEVASELEKKGNGKGSSGDLDKLHDLMEETETDLVNKRITAETLRRQQEILTRLLEAEKAERQRDEEERRESKEGKNEKLSNPPVFNEYNRRKLKETELLKTVPPSLQPFYRDKVNEYFNKTNQ